MLNKYPLWKYVLIVVVMLIGAYYSAPNLYPDDPAIQISGNSTSLQVNQADLDRVTQALTAAGITVKASSLADGGKGGLLRLTRQEDQLPAKDVVRKVLGDDYVVALNLAQTTPQWLRTLGGKPMKLGLDLSGGVHFLLAVDMDKAIDARVKVYDGDVKTELRKEKVRYRALPQKDNTIVLGFADDATRSQARDLIHTGFPDLTQTATQVPGTEGGDFVLSLAMTPAKLTEIREYSIRQNLTTVRNRVNELGVSEPLVQRQGANRIVVELPGVQDTAEAKRILGKTASLEFRLAADAGAVAGTSESMEFRDHSRPAAQLERTLILTGDQVTGAKAGFDEHGRPQVDITLDGRGGDLMSRATRNNVGRSMAVVFIEQKPITRYVKQNVDGVDKDVAVQSFKEDKSIISLATIQSPLGSRFRITGLNGPGESSELALLLRAGGLAAPMYFAEERTIGPSLGADNITKGIHASLWGMLFVSLFIIAIYRFFGVIATVALAINMVLLLAVMSIFGATLTLPGIAGIVLTMGMAVDANVLIFSRIREELANGMAVQRAINEGFGRAFTAILDANLTTLLVGGILFAMGTGPVKGFAVTMSLGIFTSMFTAIMVTRGIVNLIYGGRDFKKLWI